MEPARRAAAAPTSVKSRNPAKIQPMTTSHISQYNIIVTSVYHHQQKINNVSMGIPLSIISIQCQRFSKISFQFNTSMNLLHEETILIRILCHQVMRLSGANKSSTHQASNLVGGRSIQTMYRRW
jgi:hypothetical protein